MYCTPFLHRAAIVAAIVCVSHLAPLEAWAHMGGAGHISIGTTASGGGAVVGGGDINTASGTLATIGGGKQNTSSGIHATVGGGLRNTASAPAATIGGGQDNTASGAAATIAGGLNNVAFGGTVGGGQKNKAQKSGATVGGGTGNTALQLESTVGGGSGNTASGIGSTVPGGQNNTASAFFTFAAGRRAKAINAGAFVWADAQNAEFASTNSNSFNVRAHGGVRFATGVGGINQMVSWTPGSGAWSFTSDEATKEKFCAVDEREVLRRVAALPVQEWNYIGYRDQRHIGPTAQDWHAAFPLNQSKKTLNMADLHGVSLVAIKGMMEELKDRDQVIEELKSELRALRHEIRRNFPPAP